MFDYNALFVFLSETLSLSLQSEPSGLGALSARMNIHSDWVAIFYYIWILTLYF